MKAPKSPKKEKKKEEVEVGFPFFFSLSFLVKKSVLQAVAPAPEEPAKEEAVAAEAPVEAVKEEAAEPVKETENAAPAPAAEVEEAEKVKTDYLHKS